MELKPATEAMTGKLPRAGTMIGVFLSVVAMLALLQVWLLRDTMPPPDGIAYFEVADQIQRVGYGQALPQHWSPLYPLYLLAIRQIVPVSVERELFVTAVADAMLLVTLCVIVMLAFRSIGKLCWPDDSRPRLAWLSYGCGLAIFLGFAILRVGLRMPDALVTSLALATLWALCHASARRLHPRWMLVAGVLGGVTYLARANLFHWSLVVGLLASLVAPAATFRQRQTGFATFCLGVFLIFGPQAYLISKANGHFMFGETGKIGFAVAYGAEWPNGAPAWPVRLQGGDVRVFTERRDLQFPGFYDPSREYNDAKISVSLPELLKVIPRAVSSCLLGNWTPSFALMWPLLWAMWPPLLFGIGPLAGRTGSPADSQPTLRWRLAWLLTLAGCAGVSMHLITFCNGYYLPPYLIASLMGVCLAMLDVPSGSLGAGDRQRAAIVAGIGLAVAATLLTMKYARTGEAVGRETNLKDAKAMAAALMRYPAGDRGLRKVAAVGDWLGLYGIRLSGSQVAADIPDPVVLHDPIRLRHAIDLLHGQGVVALLVPQRTLRAGDQVIWQSIGSGAWAIVDLRPTQDHAIEQ